MQHNDQNFLKVLGGNIASKRKSLGYTQADLAYLIGMEVPNLSVIENGKSNPQVLTLMRIAAALGCNLSELLPNFDNPNLLLEARPKYVPRKYK
ncbi:MAG: hypothetical protein RL092_1396 [Bacteroidota bacterium]|jgi:transcriptional regulator with XRE-family HTH domain